MIALKQRSETEKLAERLRKMIRSGVMAPGTRLQSMRELASREQVGVNIVRNSFAKLTSEGLLERHHGSGTFVTDRSASEKKLTGLFTTHHQGNVEGYFEALTAIATQKRRPCFPVSTNPRLGDWRSDFELLVSHTPSMIFVDVDAHRIPLDELLELSDSIPLCFVNRWAWDAPPPPCGVLIDYVSPLTTAIDLLMREGHERIIFCGYFLTPYPDTRKRLSEAAERAGLRFPSEKLDYVGIYEQADFKGKSLSDEQLRSIFKNTDKAPTAAIALSDYEAVKFRERLDLFDPGLSENLKFIGFHDTMWSKVPDREFSSFRINYPKLWNAAFDLFDGKANENGGVIRQLPELIVR